ncbi:hypothetical protein PIB30_119225 [Stylosanthes scabra]|uniref:DUF4219 domain-containing protein n=1 Tax=Stylosanthes scabra TaxID=79078 RepID=A0ABU6WDE9_9FABA|nr:hypothetical protein [Stylosanthes scabra]
MRHRARRNRELSEGLRRGKPKTRREKNWKNNAPNLKKPPVLIVIAIAASSSPSAFVPLPRRVFVTTTLSRPCSSIPSASAFQHRSLRPPLRVRHRALPFVHSLLATSLPSTGAALLWFVTMCQESSLTFWSKNSMAYTLIEGHSSNRPPFFNGKNYAYWKERMMVFVQSIDYNIWKIILNGPNIPTKTTAEGNVVPKEEHEWDDEDKKKVEFNAKAMNMMYCAISFEEFQKMSRCKSAKDIWDKLKLFTREQNK